MNHERFSELNLKYQSKEGTSQAGEHMCFCNGSCNNGHESHGYDDDNNSFDITILKLG